MPRRSAAGSGVGLSSAPPSRGCFAVWRPDSGPIHRRVVVVRLRSTAIWSPGCEGQQTRSGSPVIGSIAAHDIGGGLMQIEFVASVAVITPNPSESRQLYMDALGLPLKQLDGEYFASQEIGGCKHFGVWPLEQAAEACFGTASWPDDVPVPQMS